jgi:hypothetical protein
LIAGIFAVAGLGWLGWSAWHPRIDASTSVTAINLWTSGAAPSQAPLSGFNVALGDAKNLPANTRVIPDLAYLRRAFPQLQAVRIFGDGIDPSQVNALRGLHVTWEQPAPVSQPIITSLSAPHTLIVGQKLTVQGRVAGLPQSSATTVSLEGPDGTAETVELTGSPDGTAPFSVASKPAVAAGRFEWKLRASAGAEPVTWGAVVIPPTLPRVLLLQASPNVEAARLQRWLAESGASVTSRTRVSAEHDRFAHANESPAEIPSVDAKALAHFDLIVTTEPALAELTAAERDALQESIRTQGLGLLVLGEGAAGKRDEFFAPWPQAIAEKPADIDETRVARLHFANGIKFEEEASALPGELSALPLSHWLARDSADRTLVAAVNRGRGWVARSLVVDTWHWLQEGHADTFATYWSSLLSALARAPAPANGTWRLENSGAPLFVSEPAHLTWSGPAEALPANVRVESSGAPPVPLQLAHANTGAESASAVFWPTQSGWQQLRSGEGNSTFSFYVQPNDALPGVRVAARHRATAQRVAESAGAPIVSVSNLATRKQIADAAAFLMFVLGAGYLWIAGRRPSIAR